MAASKKKTVKKKAVKPANSEVNLLKAQIAKLEAAILPMHAENAQLRDLLSTINVSAEAAEVRMRKVFGGNTFLPYIYEIKTAVKKGESIRGDNKSDKEDMGNSSGNGDTDSDKSK